ncbi:unnamed protein product, partial [Natator depressus]
STYANPTTQPQRTVTIQEGKTVILHCTYNSSLVQSLFWYEQYAQDTPRVLLTQYEASSQQEKRHRRGFSANHQKDSKFFHLKKNSSEVSDSAVYHCTLRDTVSKAPKAAVQKSQD